MKFIALTLLAVLATAFATPVQENHELTSSEERVIEFLKDYRQEMKKVIHETMKDVAEAICEKKDYDLETPLQEVIQRCDDVDEEAETLCNLVKNHLKHVLEPLTKAVDGCLPHEESGVASFLVDAVVGTVCHLCQMDGEQLFELANPCIDSIDLEGDKCITDCTNKWNELTQSTKPFKEEVCSEYSEVKPCLETAIHKNCKLEVTREALMGVVDSVFHACSA